METLPSQNYILCSSVYYKIMAASLRNFSKSKFVCLGWHKFGCMELIRITSTSSVISMGSNDVTLQTIGRQ